MLLPRAHTIDIAAVISHFTEHGYARLGCVLDPDGARILGDRANALMTASEAVPGVFYQHDSPTRKYEDLAFNSGWKGPSLHYRKLEKLEVDPLFLNWIRNPLFMRIAAEMLGEPIRLYRSVLWNKAPQAGMAVPWHQDDGKFWGLNRSPILQVWTALDDASEEAGCLEVVPGSHLGGLASREGGTIDKADYNNAVSVKLPAKQGECILVHNHLWHRTGFNGTAKPRKAMSVSFLDGETRCKRKRRSPRTFLQLSD